jgi:hypothetical protein
MKYTNVKTPKWADFEQTTIDCMVDFDDLVEDFVPFSAVANGDYPHTSEIFARCVAGEFGEVAAYTPPAVYAATYKELRAAAYPSIPDQLDTIYHSGIDAWKATILAVKEEFPK